MRASAPKPWGPALPRPIKVARLPASSLISCLSSRVYVGRPIVSQSSILCCFPGQACGISGPGRFRAPDPLKNAHALIGPCRAGTKTTQSSGLHTVSPTASCQRSNPECLHGLSAYMALFVLCLELSAEERNDCTSIWKEFI